MEIDLSIGVFGSAHDHGLKRVWNGLEFFSDDLFGRQETDISLDGIFTDFPVNSSSELTRKEKSILIIDVVFLILLIPSIDKGIYHGNHRYKMFVLCFNKSKHAVIHAGRIN